MSKTVKLIHDNKEYELPVVTASTGEKAIDISTLLNKTGFITLDVGYANTGSCTSTITYMDGEKGILRYRGYPIEELAKNCNFVEVAFLLTNGHLPNEQERRRFSVQLNDHSLVHEDMRRFFDSFPHGAHPMGILASMVTAMRSFYPERYLEEEEISISTTRLISKVRTMAAMSYRISRGQNIVYPRPDLCYCGNFLNMMFDTPVKPYEIDPDIVRAVNIFWVLHADHEQNCSTSAVRMVGSARVNLYAAISAGISALWGPLHGGANQAVIEMLEEIHKTGESPKLYVNRAKDKNSTYRLMGFGHRVYKTYDPRAKIIKNMCHTLLKKLNRTDPLLDIAYEIEELVSKDDYFVSRNLYPNVDFYSGIILRAIGIPTNMFPVMFAIGRLPGWISQWREDSEDPNWRICRPRQIYLGDVEKKFIPINERG